MKNNMLILLIISVIIMLFSIPVLTSAMLESYSQAVKETEYERGWIKGYKSASLFYNSNSKTSKIPSTKPPVIIQDMYSFRTGYYNGFRKRMHEE